MADKLIAGGPPPADVANFPPGTLFWQVMQEDDDVTGRKFTLSTWSQQLPNQIEWGDNSQTIPAAWSVAPAGPGLLGRLNVTHTYTGRPGTIYRWFVEAGGVRDHGTIAAGEPAVIDDVTRDGIKRPPEDSQTQIFTERGKLVVSVRKQMGVMPDRRGGRVN